MTIYNEIGGREAVVAAVDVFYARVLADDLLAPYFAGTEMRRQKAHMRAFLTTALGGADLYAGRDMAAAHGGLGITYAAFDRVVEHLAATLTELQIPDTTIERIGGTLLPLRDVVTEEPVLAAA